MPTRPRPAATATGLCDTTHAFSRLIHRNVIHPRFGSFVTLGTVLVAAEVTEQGAPLDYNPCLECVRRRFPHKRPKRVHNGLHPRTIRGLLALLPSLFQRGQARDLAATYHLRFTGDEPREATVTIRDGKLAVEHRLAGTPDLTVTADARTWLRFLAGDASLLWALVRRKIRLKGDRRLLAAFGRCFPS